MRHLDEISTRSKKICSSFRFNNRREYIEVLGLNCHCCGFITKKNLVGNSGCAPDFSEGGGTMRSCSITCLTHQKLMKLCSYCRSDRAGHISCQYSLKSQPRCVMKFTGNFLYFFLFARNLMDLMTLALLNLPSLCLLLLCRTSTATRARSQPCRLPPTVVTWQRTPTLTATSPSGR